MNHSRTVVITGIGCVSPFGRGVDVFAEAIFSGRSAARQIGHFDISTIPTHFAAPVVIDEAELDGLVENQKMLKTLSRSGKFAIVAAQDAVASAGISFDSNNPYRVGTSMGAGGLGLWDLDYTDETLDIVYKSELSGEPGRGAIQNGAYGQVWKNLLEQVHPLTPLKVLSNVPTGHIAIKYNARGICQTITTACTSSAQAIGEAYRQIKAGVADVMIAGGSDSMINPYGMVAFSTLGVLSRRNDEWQSASRPFDNSRDGFMLGEGAAVFVLESLEHCRSRGAEPLAELAGYATTCDAYRLTDSPPDGRGSIASMRSALEDAQMRPEQIDYINAHGTGTQMNDASETHAIKAVFGNAAYQIPVSSTKSMIGHLVAAAGGIELAVSVLALQYGILPATINYQSPDPECDLDYLPNTAREMKVNTVLSNSFGFGGQNATLIVNKF